MVNNLSNKILVIAGEASGDLHGAALIKEINSQSSGIDFFGIGGDKMISAGLNPIYHINQMAFLGFIEVIKHIPFIRKVKKDLIDLVVKENISHVVLIDYPGFNLSIAKSFKRMGLNIIYYISPQIWAWGKGRIKKIKSIVNRMIVFFPFEKELYKSHGVKTDFIGHPLAKKIESYNFSTKEELIDSYNLDTKKDILLLMPGSRLQEIKEILPITLSAAKVLENKFNLQTVIACADNIDENIFKPIINLSDVKIIKGNTYNILKNSKFAIVKSGTSTLEAGIIGTPFIVVYKTNYFTYLIGKALIKIKNIALVNIVGGETIIPELIQNDVNEENIVKESSLILEDNSRYKKIKEKLENVKNILATDGNPSSKAAKIIIDEMNVA